MIYADEDKSNALEITDLNRPHLLRRLQNRFQTGGQGEGSTYNTIYTLCQQLLEGFFEQSLLTNAFRCLRRDRESLSQLREYVRRAESIFKDDDEEESEEFQVVSEVSSVFQHEEFPLRELMVEEVRQVGKSLSEQIDLYFFQGCRGEFERLSPIHHIQPQLQPYRAPLILVQTIALTIGECHLSVSPPKHFNTSSVSTNSGHSITKSCLLNQKNKEFIKAEENQRLVDVDYKKEYQKKMHTSFLRSALCGYNKPKRR